MTVSDFAVAMYGCDVVKDRVKVIRDGEVLYDDRMEFLRYAHEINSNMWFAEETIQEVKMVADENVRELDYIPDYTTEIII